MKIELGDKVRHLTNNEYNAFLMTVIDKVEQSSLCEYTELREDKTLSKWFKDEELEKVIPPEGGAFNL